MKFLEGHRMNHIWSGKRSAAVSLIFICVLFSGCGFAGCARKESETELYGGGADTEIAEILELAYAYKDIYIKGKEEARKDGKENIAKETQKEIIGAIGDLGYSAVDTDNQTDMTNPETVRQFCEQAFSGKQAGVRIIAVHQSGGLTQYDLAAEKKNLTVKETSVTWEDEEPVISSTDSYEAVRWNYSQETYLFFEKEYPSGYDGPSGSTALRVRALDEKCRELNERYIAPIGYDHNNMLIAEWPGEDYGELDFYDLYEKMYYPLFTRAHTVDKE